MNTAQLRVSVAAASDILEQADWYENQSSRTLAQRWEKAVMSALLKILRNSKSGATCRFEAPELREVRRVSISGFPKHLVFYSFEGDAVLILRVVHGARDLESLL